MCGINGVVNLLNSTLHVDAGSMSERLNHRGPNGNGLWRSECRRVILCHRRLSIIDLSEASSQPMPSKDGRYSIIYNGELYNFEALRNELAQSGWKFESNGDTEVILAAYATWGEACLERFNGMFAFAIYDKGTEPDSATLFIARDRVGEKPFYYSYADGLFQFASELKGLKHSAEINLNSLNHYLALGYVPGNMCLFVGVSKLPAGHCGKLNLATGVLEIHRYWNLPRNTADSKLSGKDLAEKAGLLIEDSVRLRLVADVPVGILLSGGLDSSLVAAAAARVSTSAVQAFTISLPGSSLDEVHHAKKVADHFGMHHHVLPLDKPSLDLLDGLAPFIDEPIADSSILPAWLVFGLARQKVTVALGGDGGDELFGGYSHYLAAQADAHRLHWVPGKLVEGLASAASYLPAGVKGRNRLSSLKGGAFQQVIWGGAYFDSRLRRRLLSGPAISELGAELEEPEHLRFNLFNQGTDPIDCMTRSDFGSILPDDFLVKVDRASMAHSLEVRAPLLDHRLVEFAFGEVPSHWKVSGGEARKLQKLLAKEWLPTSLDINRKQGFSIPINEWLCNESEERLMARMQGLPEVINLEEVRSLVKGHLAGRTNGGRLFALIMLAIAMRNLH